MATIDMFGPGGEGLAGMFMGQQQADQQALQQAQEAQAYGSAAHAQALADQTGLANQMTRELYPEMVSSKRAAIQNDLDTANAAKFERQGQQFGQLGSLLSTMPAAARPAALRQIAAQHGMDMDSPMMQSFLTADPETLPDVMGKLSNDFYMASDKGRAEKFKRDEMYKQAEMQAQIRRDQAAAHDDAMREIAAGRNSTQITIQGMRGDTAESVADKRAAAKGKAGGVDYSKMGVDKAIAYLEMKRAAEPDSFTEGDATALANFQRFKLTQAAVGKNTTGADVMNNRPVSTPMEQVDQGVANLSGKAPTQQAPAAGQPAPADVQSALKRMGQRYEPNLYDYRVVNGVLQKRPKGGQGSGVPQ